MLLRSHLLCMLRGLYQAGAESPALSLVAEYVQAVDPFGAYISLDDFAAFLGALQSARPDLAADFAFIARACRVLPCYSPPAVPAEPLPVPGVWRAAYQALHPRGPELLRVAARLRLDPGCPDALFCVSRATRHSTRDCVACRGGGQRDAHHR